MTQATTPSRCLRTALAALALVLAPAAAPTAAAAPDPVAPDGTVTISNVSVPVSNLMSPEAQAYLRHLLVDRPFAGGPRADVDIAGYRARQDEIMDTFLRPIRARYAVKVEQQRIGGIPVEIVTPVAGVAVRNRHRVLLNVHGGGFVSGARTASLVESIPIAATMGIKVISIDYRMYPEHRFPAASEDVAAVYREVLKRHRPGQIGLYGCSAGGVLTGQSIAWFQTHKLPNPGAIGVLCAALGEFVAGDSASIAGPLNGMPSFPKPAGPPKSPFGYMQGAAFSDPIAYPLASPALLAKFPPTILVTGSRSMEFSTAITTHNALARAGADAELHVWDGMVHAFFYNSEMPESRDVYAAVSRFFDRHLSR
jgi:epsilon-lactone hydrolase